MDFGKVKTKGWPGTANLHSNVNYCNGIKVCRLPCALGYLVLTLRPSVENRHHHNILIPSMMLMQFRVNERVFYRINLGVGSCVVCSSYNHAAKIR
jgi:hypothetical protein